MALTDDMFSFSAFDPAKLTQSWHEFAEQGATRSRDTYGKMKSAVEEASSTVESTIHSAQSGSMEIGIKAVDAMRTNAEMSFAHMDALMGARSLSEVFQLQTSFMRRQAELTVEQAMGLQEMARKVAGEMSRPGAEAAEKMMNGLRPS